MSVAYAPLASAKNRIDELRDSIASKNEALGELEREIARLDSQIGDVNKEKQSITNTIKEIDITRKKISKDIDLTRTKIERADLSISRIDVDIGEHESAIRRARKHIGAAIREMNNENDTTSLEILLSRHTWASIWNSVSALEQLQDRLHGSLADISRSKQGLESDRILRSSEKRSLVELRDELGDKKRLADIAREHKRSLLAETKSLEAEYQQLLAEHLAKKRAFEDELFQLESELKFTLDPATIPATGKGVLSWPVPNPVITQEFGNTKFAAANRGVYNGQGHNGIDLRASIGTSVIAAASGTVLGTGDTDLTCRGSSYGKWALVEHDNGLTTLYAHLSLISVSAGTKVARGQLIGYSGNTGYSTGPHLHFTVYASAAVQIGQLRSRTPGCGTYTIPRAALNAYLDPIEYLPG
ncbi:MAG: peptidoglycan DD-metalloendopeptidase family protein [Candidatus Vogelbacteria bacterium]|nr:peptidoglycan DD-metalloendopeptidase family protein [Candidatus Vogelbacteria bacterium]